MQRLINFTLSSLHFKYCENCLKYISIFFDAMQVIVEASQWLEQRIFWRERRAYLGLEGLQRNFDMGYNNHA